MKLFTVVLLLSSSSLAGAIELTGTILSDDPQLSRAMVVERGDVKLVSVGDMVSGARIVEITPRSIIVSRGGALQEVRFGGTATSTSLAISPQPSAESRPSSPYQLDGFLSVEWFARSGRGRGLKFSPIGGGSRLKRSPLQAGDIIESINGVTLDSSVAAMAQWNAIKDQPSAELVVFRNGQSVNISLDLRSF